MGLALIRVCITDTIYTSSTTNHKNNYGGINSILYLGTRDGPVWELWSNLIVAPQHPHTQLSFLFQIHRLYRGGGGSLQRAQEEWSTGVWKSAPVREAAFNAISETGPSLPQYPASVPSYPENRPW